MPDMDQWESHFALRKVTIENGKEVVNQPVMRRKLGDGWEYRAMTAEEEHDYVSADAW